MNKKDLLILKTLLRRFHHEYIEDPHDHSVSNQLTLLIQKEINRAEGGDGKNIDMITT